MTIETKFSPGDTLFFMKNDKVHSQVFTAIETNVRKTTEGVLNTHTRYAFWGREHASSSGAFEWLYENQLFKSKEELLASL